MPEFTPTEWMLDNHADKGKEDWEIFGECVREAMCRQGKFDKCDRPIRDKLEYEFLMKGETDVAQIDGKTFTYPQGEKNDASYHSVLKTPADKSGRS